MTIAQKIILIALLAVGALGLLVGFVLMHHIGGFLRTVEEEAREQERSDERADGEKRQHPDNDDNRSMP